MIRRRARIMWDLYSYVRGLLVLYVLLVIVGVAVEGLALAAIVPLIEGSTGDGGSSSGFGGIYGTIMDAVGLDTSSEIALVAVVGVLFVIRSVCQYSSSLVQGVMVRRQAVRLQVEMFELYMGLSWEKSLAITQGEANMLLGGQVSTVGQFLAKIVSLAEGVLYTVGLTIVAVLLSPQNTVVAVVLIGTSGIGVTVIANRIRRYAKEVLAHQKAQAGVLLQYARGVQVLRSYDVTHAAVGDIARLAETRERLAYRSQRVGALANVLPDLAFVIALLAVVGLAFRADSGFAEVGAVVALLFRVSQYLKRFSNFTQLNAMIPAVTDVHRFRTMFLKNQSARVHDVIDPALPIGALHVDDVTFRYDGAPTTAVDRVSFHVEPGEFIGIVGSSGSGKSTLVQMLVGLLEPQKGAVRLGVERTDGHGWGLAYVPQSPFVLKGTMASNVAWFRDHTDTEIQAACEAAGLGGLLARLPDGIHTEISQEGLTLSGGERQRLAMARALVGRPQILLLDEATSALDSESERAIQAALERMHGTVTVVAVAHRLSTVLDADRILVLEHGNLVEEASPSELLGTAGSRFAELSAMQGIQTGS